MRSSTTRSGLEPVTLCDRGEPVARDLDREPLAAQPGRDRFGDRRLVFDDEHRAGGARSAARRQDLGHRRTMLGSACRGVSGMCGFGEDRPVSDSGAVGEGVAGAIASSTPSRTRTRARPRRTRCSPPARARVEVLVVERVAQALGADPARRAAERHEREQRARRAAAARRSSRTTTTCASPTQASSVRAACTAGRGEQRRGWRAKWSRRPPWPPTTVTAPVAPGRARRRAPARGRSGPCPAGGPRPRRPCRSRVRRARRRPPSRGRRRRGRRGDRGPGRARDPNWRR